MNCTFFEIPKRIEVPCQTYQDCGADIPPMCPKGPIVQSRGCRVWRCWQGAGEEGGDYTTTTINYQLILTIIAGSIVAALIVAGVYLIYNHLRGRCRALHFCTTPGGRWSFYHRRTCRSSSGGVNIIITTPHFTAGELCADDASSESSSDSSASVRSTYPLLK